MDEYYANRISFDLVTDDSDLFPPDEFYEMWEAKEKPSHERLK